MVVRTDTGRALQGLVLIPKPSTWATALLGFAGLSFAGYRQARVSASTR